MGHAAMHRGRCDGGSRRFCSEMPSKSSQQQSQQRRDENAFSVLFRTRGSRPGPHPGYQPHDNRIGTPPRPPPFFLIFQISRLRGRRGLGCADLVKGSLSSTSSLLVALLSIIIMTIDNSQLTWTGLPRPREQKPYGYDGTDHSDYTLQCCQIRDQCCAPLVCRLYDFLKHSAKKSTLLGPWPGDSRARQRRGVLTSSSTASSLCA